MPLAPGGDPHFCCGVAGVGGDEADLAAGHAAELGATA